MFHTMEDILNDLQHFHAGHRFQGAFAPRFNEGFADFASNFAPRFAERDVSMPVNIYEAKDHILVTCRLPGVQPENVDVNLHQDVLTIKGKVESPKDNADYYNRERAFGSFTKELPLPFVASASDSIDAQLQDGLLRVKLPIPAESQTRKIKISVQ